MNPRKPFAFHPFFFAIYPILFLLSQNMDEVSLNDTLKPIMSSVVLAGILFLLMRLLLKSTYKASMISSIALIMFFSYGHVYTRFIDCRVIAGFLVGRNIIFFPLWALLFLGLFVAIARSKSTMESSTSFMNVASISLVAISIFNIGLGELRGKSDTSMAVKWDKYINSTCDSVRLHPPEGTKLPDIYFIILDEYARDDVLNDYYGYDNRSFKKYLQSKGFYVPSDSRCNYMETYLSLASSLNMGYLQDLGKSVGTDKMDRTLFGEMIQSNATCTLLQRMGYKFVFFPSSYSATSRSRHADITISRKGLNLDEFDSILVDTSVLRLLNAGYKTHRQDILYTFDQLGKLPERREPIIAFAHITIPHPPFLFDAKGNLPGSGVSKSTLGESAYVKGYDDQLAFTNAKVRQMVDSILAKSATPPIIIIHADHGPGYMAPTLVSKSGTVADADTRVLIRGPIMSAYYFPNGGTRILNQAMSPVNDFRAMFDYYFGGKFPILENHTYKALWSSPKGHVAEFKQVAVPRR